MDRRMQVKQFVAVVRGALCRFMVYETGDPAFYLFAQMDPDGNLTTLSWPVRKADLRDDIRHALRNGVGNSHAGKDDGR